MIRRRSKSCMSRYSVEILPCSPYSCRYVAFLSGLAHVTLPNATGEVWIQGGKYGLLIAVDNATVSKYGHITTYPSDADTVTLQVPFASGVAPNHTVLHEGPCTWPEMTGI